MQGNSSAISSAQTLSGFATSRAEVVTAQELWFRMAWLLPPEWDASEVCQIIFIRRESSNKVAASKCGKVALLATPKGRPLSDESFEVWCRWLKLDTVSVIVIAKIRLCEVL